jgi:hypothetical protein
MLGPNSSVGEIQFPTAFAKAELCDRAATHQRRPPGCILSLAFEPLASPKLSEQLGLSMQQVGLAFAKLLFSHRPLRLGLRPADCNSRGASPADEDSHLSPFISASGRNLRPLM